MPPQELLLQIQTIQEKLGCKTEHRYFAIHSLSDNLVSLKPSKYFPMRGDTCNLHEATSAKMLPDGNIWDNIMIC
jgi:hypothetical protein